MLLKVEIPEFKLRFCAWCWALGVWGGLAFVIFLCSVVICRPFRLLLGFFWWFFWLLTDGSFFLLLRWFFGNFDYLGYVLVILSYFLGDLPLFFLLAIMEYFLAISWLVHGDLFGFFFGWFSAIFLPFWVIQLAKLKNVTFARDKHAKKLGVPPQDLWSYDHDPILLVLILIIFVSQEGYLQDNLLAPFIFFVYKETIFSHQRGGCAIDKPWAGGGGGG